MKLGESNPRISLIFTDERLSRLPRVYIDFNDMIGPNCFALICRGTEDDIRTQGLILTEGMRLKVYDAELEAVGTVGRSNRNEGWPGEGRWIINIDEKTWREIPPDE